jgi:NhaP-type Na+/H+ or K+/H+ antiporter
MTFAVWCAIAGVLLITMALGASFLRRLPLSTSMLYLLAGVGLGPAGLQLLDADPFVYSGLLEVMTEIVVLISLFVSGLKLSVPLRDARWHLPLRLALVSMLLTIAMITAAGVWGLGLSLGAAVLLGAILAPTDPVLASDVQVEGGSDRDRLRFALTGEGGLNDGAAFPFVMLGLGLLGLHGLGTAGWRWVAVDLAWAVIGGLAVGALLGYLVGKLVLYLRVHHKEAVGLDQFLALGLIALAYGTALLLHTYGFLAVFAAALALRRIEDRPEDIGALHGAMQDADGTPGGNAEAEVATDPCHAAHYMTHAVLGFDEQIERIGEIAMVLVIGAMLSYVDWLDAVWWFVPLVLLVIRPAGVGLGLLGSRSTRSQRGLMAWFGIRGIGSIYYLMYAINHGLERALAEQLVSLTLIVVATSIVVHGISVTPLMLRYGRRHRPDAAAAPAKDVPPG